MARIKSPPLRTVLAVATREGRPRGPVALLTALDSGELGEETSPSYRENGIAAQSMELEDTKNYETTCGCRPSAVFERDIRHSLCQRYSASGIPQSAEW